MEPPTPSPRPAAPPRGTNAVASAASAWRAWLAASPARLEPISFEEIVAYVDRRLPDERRAALAERLGHDPALAAEVEDLENLRAELAPARVLKFRARPVQFRWALAAAAALLLALGSSYLVPRLAPESRGATDAALDTAPAAKATVFTDGFESGDSTRWSTAAEPR